MKPLRQVTGWRHWQLPIGFYPMWCCWIYVCPPWMAWKQPGISLSLLGQPLKVLYQFRCFSYQSHGKIFWRVKLIPVALERKGG